MLPFLLYKNKSSEITTRDIQSTPKKYSRIPICVHLSSEEKKRKKERCRRKTAKRKQNMQEKTKFASNNSPTSRKFRTFFGVINKQGRQKVVPVERIINQ
ncbi:hypothetical protein SAY87_030103 [Trapa incisa]|uniref:Uncharacterized protein n=2 Tax=Trapa TaxID=22665 RepID=A0AAN7KLJ9_TRANT|nr:hypothetical protein SAY87_030103 [Trapa incisa]KAK4768825.1 hypothetical protein SAY86_026975 [Trapa natans]